MGAQLMTFKNRLPEAEEGVSSLSMRRDPAMRSLREKPSRLAFPGTWHRGVCRMALPQLLAPRANLGLGFWCRTTRVTHFSTRCRGSRCCPRRAETGLEDDHSPNALSALPVKSSRIVCACVAWAAADEDNNGYVIRRALHGVRCCIGGDETVLRQTDGLRVLTET